MCVFVCICGGGWWGDAEYTLGFDLMLSPVHLLLLRRKSGIFLVMGERVAKYPEGTASNLTTQCHLCLGSKVGRCEAAQERLPRSYD